MTRIKSALLPMFCAAAGAAVMLICLAPAHADPLVSVTPSGIELSWQGWLMTAVVVAGSALKILDVLLAALKAIAPRTKTTIDDQARDKVQVVDTFAHDKLDAILSVVGAMVPRVGVPSSAAFSAGAAPAQTVGPQPRDSQAGFCRFRVMGAIAGAGLTLLVVLACTAAQRSTAATAAGHAVVNCTAQALGTAPGLDLATLVAIANTVAAERAACMTPAGLDWKCVERDAVAKGVTLGGCTLVEMVAAAAGALKPSGSALVAADPAPPPGRVELERFRAQVAGGAMFHTSAGDL